MFGQNREKKRFSWRWAVLLVSLVAGALVFAACGESATPTPDPTATPVLTPTPDPTATPVLTPTPDPTATPVPRSHPLPRPSQRPLPQ